MNDTLLHHIIQKLEGDQTPITLTPSDLLSVDSTAKVVFEVPLSEILNGVINSLREGSGDGA